MELGPRDKVSQAFWHEWRKGNTISTPRGDVVYLDLRHLGEKNCMNVCRSSANWRKRTLASIRLKNRFRYVRPHTTPWAVSKPIRTVKPALKVCSPWVNVPLLVCTVQTVWVLTPAELVVFGRLAGEQATERAATAGNGNEAAIEAQAAGVEQRLKDLVNPGWRRKLGEDPRRNGRQWKKVAVSTVRRN